jgi:hypothetical protein
MSEVRKLFDQLAIELKRHTTTSFSIAEYITASDMAYKAGAYDEWRKSHQNRELQPGDEQEII